MKVTGIVRRIDDLGRVVIPKEIRRTMRIREERLVDNIGAVGSLLAGGAGVGEAERVGYIEKVGHNVLCPTARFIPLLRSRSSRRRRSG